MTDALFSLKGETVLITGGTRGIGQSVAVGLAEAGADIILVQVCQSHSQYCPRGFPRKMKKLNEP